MLLYSCYLAAGVCKHEDVDKTKSPVTSQTTPGNGKDSQARHLFDKPSVDDCKPSIVPVRGEPEGESKQPAVVTVQRQVSSFSRPIVKYVCYSATGSADQS